MTRRFLIGRLTFVVMCLICGVGAFEIARIIARF